ncbi:MAG: NAD(P)/FAD-dependent oxidoreductase [Pseudomonadota bacterium]
MRASDVAVIGGGAWGLWTARACLAAGLSVTVADRAHVGGGAGASATPVGALSPHMAAPWTPLKAFQFEALARMPKDVAALEAETGRRVGYARPGRLQPLETRAARARAETRAAEAREIWSEGRMQVLDGVGAVWSEGWLAPSAHGALHDDLSARIDPPALLAALRAACEAGGAQMLDGWTFLGWERGRAVFDRGEVGAQAAVIAAGAESFDHLPGVEGGAEHGQAARLALRAPEGAPLIGAPGLWIVPHADGTVGVGSTAERDRWDTETDAGLEAVLERARGLCPALGEAEVLARWAGLRPRAASRSPVIGPVPGRPGLFAATGGFKIGLALGATAGRALAEMLTGGAPGLPEAFRPGA